MMPALFRRALLVAAVAAVAAMSCGGEEQPQPLPSPVVFRQEPDGVTIGDPAFEPLPGARADFGRLGGAVYQIEVPDDWNGRLVLFMHGYGELAPEARVSAPGIRTYLVLHGYAWGASSFSSTSSIPGRAADETAALWDFFVRKYGRPERTYVTGQSMGGAASHIAAERYGDRFDGALGLCGSAGQTSGAQQQADFFVAAAYVAGVTQAEFDAATDVFELVRERILPALDGAAAHSRWEDIMIDLTGGPRPFDREGFHGEEETNWERAQLLVAAGLAPNGDRTYRLGPVSDVPSDGFNRDVIRLRLNSDLMRTFTDGEDTTGKLQVPLLTLHTTGDGQVPIEQARTLRRRVDAADTSHLLVQRVFRDPGHCGFTYREWEAGLEALIGWVERGERPAGQDLLVEDLRTLGGGFELAPRPGSPEADAVPGASDRVTLRGVLTLDGAPFDATFLGAVVRKDGLIAPCQYTLPTVEDGRYQIAIRAEAEKAGCGGEGAEIFLWTFARDRRLFSLGSVPWPGDGAEVTVDARFSTAQPDGILPPVTEFAGEAFEAGGERFPPGARVEAVIDGVVCGVSSLQYTGSFSGYVLAVVGPESVAGCEHGATITFRVDGRTALQTAVNDPGAERRGSGLTDLIVP